MRTEADGLKHLFGAAEIARVAIRGTRCDKDLRWRTPQQAVRLILTGRTFAPAAKVALIVGTLLTLVNQFPALRSGNLDFYVLLRTLANYLIPYTVSSLGFLSAFRERDCADQATSPSSAR